MLHRDARRIEQGRRTAQGLEGADDSPTRVEDVHLVETVVHDKDLGGRGVVNDPLREHDGGPAEFTGDQALGVQDHDVILRQVEIARGGIEGAPIDEIAVGRSEVRARAGDHRLAGTEAGIVK